MSEVIFIIEESAEGGFEARALDYSIYTEAKYIESLKEAVKDAVLCHFGKANTPKLIRLHPDFCYSNITQFPIRFL